MVNYSSYDRTVPTVRFDSKELEAFMFDFMMENSCNSQKRVSEYLGLVMLRFGFKSEDKIELRNFSNDRSKNIQCIVNDSDYYDIRFDNVGNKKEHTKISLINFNIETTYECFPLNLSELGVRIIPVKEVVMYADGVNYTREFSRDKAKFVVSYLDCSLELDVVKPKNLELPMYDADGSYSRYRLNNENMLVKYLSDFFLVWCSKDILGVYRNICDISLGSDISDYQEIFLRCVCGDKVTDLIHLRNGELERFGITLSNLGRTLFLNKDGSYTYEIADREDLFKFSMNVDGDDTSYNMFIKNGSDMIMINEIIQSDINEVKNNIGNFKSLVRKKFDCNRKK